MVPPVADAVAKASSLCGIVGKLDSALRPIEIRRRYQDFRPKQFEKPEVLRRIGDTGYKRALWQQLKAIDGWPNGSSDISFVRKHIAYKAICIKYESAL